MKALNRRVQAMEAKLSIKPLSPEDLAENARAIARLEQMAATGDEHAKRILEQLDQCREIGVMLDVTRLSDAELRLLIRSYEMDDES